MVSLEPYGNLIREMIAQNLSHADISTNLLQLGVQQGCSEMSVRRFCAHHNISRRGQVSDTQLEVAISRAINQTGSTYGRKMMTGYLSAMGVVAGERRVGNILRTTHCPYHEMRKRGARNLNPVPYSAAYMGHKVHIDQNEKLVMFGVTHVLAMDGYSSKVVAHATMPVKNNLTIYEDVYRSAVLEYGMWDQVRVDHGREFYLTLYMQEMLSNHRHNLQRQPYLQTQSTKNHTVERMWVEINNRVNYPLKEALMQLQDQEVLDMDDNVTRYCTSNLTAELCKIGLTRAVLAWNAHRIPSKGTPNHLAAGGCPKKVGDELLPHASQAADMYQQDVGSSLTRVSCFGTDPFTTEDDKISAEQRFAEEYSDISVLLDNAVNYNFAPFQDALMLLINITQQYA
uniref:uncharacterized protein LOC124065345 isoform X1 n=1 Tax=Scatophagus argus TaxID=75038 RepID=UPI001ED82E04|nr:uncharacterized protein LOC124065345 isoform X1 [Scatophagus argus]